MPIIDREANTPLTRILTKIRNNQSLTPSETTYYNKQLRLNRNLPHLPATSNSLASWPATTFSNTPGNSLASSPATNYTPNTQPGYGPSDVAHNTSQASYVPNPTPTGYGPTLAQEQAQAQHNANSQGGTTYRPNPVAAATPATPAGGNTGQSPASTGIDIPPFITKLPDEQFPNVPNVTLAWHDFTKQAQQKVAGAYAPLYQAIQSGKTNATAQERNSDAVIKGMYDQLAAGNVKDQTATNAQYAAANHATVANNAALQNTLGGSASSAAAEMAKILASSGSNGSTGTAAADELASVIGPNSAAMMNAKTQAAQDVTNVATQKNDQLDYQRNLAAADRQQGEATREGLVNQLADVLHQYDQQTLSTKSDEAQQGLSMGQQMSQNDYTAQQGSAEQTWNKYNAAMGQTNAKIGIDQANAGLQNNAAGAALSAQTSITNANADRQEKQYEFDTTTKATNARDEINRRIAEATLNQTITHQSNQDKIDQQRVDQKLDVNGNPIKRSANPNDPNYDPLLDATSPEYRAAHNPQTLYRNTLTGLLGGTKNEPLLEQILSSTFAGMGDAMKGKPGQVNQYDYMNKVVEAAAKYGIGEGTARAAALAFQQLYGTQQTVLPPVPVSGSGG